MHNFPFLSFSICETMNLLIYKQEVKKHASDFLKPIIKRNTRGMGREKKDEERLYIWGIVLLLFTNCYRNQHKKTYTTHSFLHGILQIHARTALIITLILNNFLIRQYLTAKSRTETRFWELSNEQVRKWAFNFHVE